ncbi:MAG: oligosaccharide flippase family protein [Butyricicoccaceae bacterium]
MRSLKSGAAVLAISNLLLQALSMVYMTMLGRLGSAESVGVLRLVQTVYYSCQGVCLAGLTMAASRLSAAQEDDRSAVSAVGRSAYSIFLVMFCAIAGALILGNDLIAERFIHEPETAAALVACLPCLVLTGYENISKSLFLGLGRNGVAAISEIGEQVVRLFAVGGFLLLAGNGMPERFCVLVFCGMTVSECFSTVFLTGMRRKLLLPARSEHFTSQILQIALPVSAASLAGNILSALSTVIVPLRMMKWGMTHEQALAAIGSLSMLSPILTIPSALIRSVSVVLMPELSAAEAHGGKRIGYRISQTLRLTAWIGIPATLLLLPCAPALMELIYHTQIPMTAVAIYSLAVICSYFQIILYSALAGLGMQAQCAAAEVILRCIQFFLTWGLTGAYGLNGYLGAELLCGMALMLILFGFLARRIPPVGLLHSVGGAITAGSVLALSEIALWHRWENLEYAMPAAMAVCFAAFGVLLWMVVHRPPARLQESH